MKFPEPMLNGVWVPAGGATESLADFQREVIQRTQAVVLARADYDALRGHFDREAQRVKEAVEQERERIACFFEKNESSTYGYDADMSAIASAIRSGK